MPTGERGYSFITERWGWNSRFLLLPLFTAWGGSGALLLLGGDEAQVPLKPLWIPAWLGRGGTLCYSCHEAFTDREVRRYFLPLGCDESPTAHLVFFNATVVGGKVVPCFSQMRVEISWTLMMGVEAKQVIFFSLPVLCGYSVISV